MLVTLFNSLTALAVIMLFVAAPVEKRLGKTANGKLLAAWRLLCRAVWGLWVWCVLTAFSSIGLHELFPEEPAYYFSGSWITIVPALLWGALIGWILLGKSEADEGDAKLASLEGRMDAVFFGAGRVLKYAAFAILAVLGIVAAYLFFGWLGGRAEEMSPSAAIIFGALIIAWAILATRQKSAGG